MARKKVKKNNGYEKYAWFVLGALCIFVLGFIVGGGKAAGIMYGNQHQVENEAINAIEDVEENEK